MTTKGLFTFCNDKFLQTQIQDDITLRIERIGMAVARVFFVREGYNEIPIPYGFKIIDHSNGDIPVKPLIGRQEYFLGWTDNYSLFYNDKEIMKLINQRQWAIEGQQERSIETLDL